MLGLGFVFARDGDTENIPDQPVEINDDATI
jgi:hypothetical protein